MDPITAIGLVASIIQLIDVTASTLKYLNDVKEAPKDRARLARETASLLALLTDLRYRVEEATPSEPWFKSIRALGIDGGPLSQFREAMEALAKKLKPESGLKKFGKALLWTVEKDDILEILSRIERLKTLVSCALQNDHFKLSLALKDDISEVKGSVRENAKVVTKLHETQKGHAEREIIDWISHLNFSGKQIDSFDRRQEGTGEWLLADSTFKSWLNGDHGVLWCPGIPGAGKTILASIIIDFLDRRFEEENVAVAYVYCSYKERAEQTPANLIASLLQQLVRRNPLISEDVLSLFNYHKTKGTRPTLSEWSKLLQSEAGRLSKIFIVIDALDECPETEGTRDNFLAEVLKLHQNARLLVTSRYIPTIESQFENAARIEICASDRDIGIYLESRIEKEKRLAGHVKKVPDLKVVIISTVRRKAKGMFLLAHLHMNSLAKKQTPRGVRDALKNLPNGLDDTYSEAMQRIQSQDEEDAQLAEQVLYWISYAYTPLTVVEIRHALAVQVGDTDLDGEALSEENILVSQCAGLVTVDQESNIMRLVHYTTQEYFERIRMERFPYAQTNIAKSCLTYISFDAFAESHCRDEKELESRLQQYPFLRYAAQYWGDHAREGMDETVKDLILRFLGHNIKVWCSNQVVEFSKFGYDRYQNYVPNVTRLHIVASFGLLEIARLLLDNGADIKAREDFGKSVLHWAAERGHESFISLILERGANINETDAKGYTALHLAAQNGHMAFVQQLLQEGANIAARARSGETTLHLAAEEGHEAVVRLLLEKWVELYVKDMRFIDSEADYGRTALHSAVENGHDTTVRLLLDRGANIAKRDEFGRTALHRAAEGGYEAVALLLLERNVDIGAKDERGETALHRAAVNGHEAMVRLFLEKKANLFEKDESGRIALQLAAANQHEMVVALLVDHMGEQSNSEKWLATAKICGAVDREEETAVRILLANGADAKVAAPRKFSLLHIAVARENEAILRLLLENGADVSALDSFGRTALHWAAARGNVSAAPLLLQYGADISAEDGLKMTPLHFAAGYGSEPLVRLLLEKGASVAARDENQNTALHNALTKDNTGDGNFTLMLEETNKQITRSNHVAVLRLLIENGVDITGKDKYGRTVLHNAIRRGRDQEEVVRLLLDEGVDINARDKNGQTVLYSSVYNSQEAILRLLLENGADIETRYTITDFNFDGEGVHADDRRANEMREEGTTVLHIAAKHGDEAILRLLLESGADVKAEDKAGETALHKAAKRGHDNVIGLLLEKGMDINLKGGDLGGTPLHWAAFKGHIALVQYLIKKGADINAKDDEGATALDWAIESGYEAMIMLLTPLFVNC